MNSSSSDWSLKRIRYLFRERNEKNHPGEEPLAATQHAGVVPKTLLDFKTMEAVSSDLSLFKLVEPGDFVISLRSFEGGLEYSGYRGILSPAYTVLSPQRDVHPNFFKHLLKSDGFVQSLARHKKGIRDGQAVPFNTLQDDYLLIPDLGTQERIANFLDEQTARIDALIAEKERLLVAAQAHFYSRLGAAVVEGLVAGAPLAPAVEKGFEAVREDWALVPLKHLASFSGGMTPSKDNELFWAGDIPWVSPKDMKRFEIYDSQDHVSQHALDATSLKVLPPESVLVVVRGMILAHTFPVALNAVEVTINQDMKAMRPKGRISSRYLAWTLRGLQSLMLSLTEESAHGTKVLRTEQWANQAIPVPSKEEQVELVACFELWEQQAIQLTSHLTNHLALLKEYRSSLIAAAVTGQLDFGALR